MFRRKNVWYFLWIFPVVVIVCLDQQLPPHTVNLALNKPATQQGDLNDKIWCPNVTGAVCGVKKASLSVDGNTDTQYWDGSCSYAVIQDKPWWQVDLGQVYNISWIKIYNRAESEYRVNSLKVTVGTLACYTHDSRKNVTPVMDIRCANVTQGRTVKVSLTSGQGLSLCEVQVLECENHWFGTNCTYQCHCINNATCDKSTGYCDKGCGDGWTGNDCQTVCSNYTYGANCIYLCHCKNNMTCDKTTGYCQNGCAAGWIGTGCQTACQNNTFGLNCTHQCHCMNNTTCDKTTGYCQNGCAAGWIGTGCQTACQNNTFGLNCIYQCHCMNNTTCDKTTGYCQNGCAAGWTGSDCQKALPTTSSFVSTTSLRSTTSSTTSGTSSTSVVSEKVSTVASNDTFIRTKTTPIDLPSTEPKTSSTGTVTGPGTAKDDVSSIITPIMVSCVIIVVVLCVTVVIVCYIRRKQGPNHQEENKNQSERHYAGLESGRDDGDYSSLNCAYEEFPNTLPDPAPPNTTDSTGHSLYANEGIEFQMRNLNPDRVVYANGAVQMD